ncbi:MAG: hypothetical protein HYS13_25465 [Planctomycetia bacterium]|nr:hypothetical protein [Planctomycetia bacterium]
MLGLVLIAAAAAKGHALATDPAWADSLSSNPWVAPGVIEAEFAFGVWLLSNRAPRITWCLMAACFLVLAAVALTEATRGAASCRCFGKVTISPWWTFAFDAAALVAIGLFRPSPPARDGETSWSMSPRFGGVLFGAWLLAAVSGGTAIAALRPAPVPVESARADDARAVVLRPEQWIGKRLPLLAHVPNAAVLGRADWVVVLHRHDCPHCQALSARIREVVSGDARRGCFRRVARIELPPHPAPSESEEPGPWLSVRLSARRTWLGTTPAILLIRDAVVLRVVDDVPSIGDFALTPPAGEALP